MFDISMTAYPVSNDCVLFNFLLKRVHVAKYSHKYMTTLPKIGSKKIKRRGYLVELLEGKRKQEKGEETAKLR